MNYDTRNHERKLLSAHVMKSYGGSEVKIHSFFTSALDGGQRSISCIQSPYLRKKSQLLRKQQGSWDRVPVS